MTMMPGVLPHLIHTRRDAGAGWMITLADLMALMLTFFVLLFSMQRIDVDRWNSLLESLDQDGDGVASKPAVLTPEDAPSLVGRDPPVADETVYYARVLRNNLLELGPGLRVDIFGSAVTVSLTEQALAAVMGDGNQVAIAANRLTEQLRRIGRAITLQGIAADGNAALTAAARWDQALARATTLSETLRIAGFPHEIHAGAIGRNGDANAATVRIVIGFGEDAEAQS